MKSGKIMSLLLAFLMILSMTPVLACAENTAGATVYITVSNQGMLAADNDGKAMINREITVEDINEDGKLTYDEALHATHKVYNSESGYVAADSGYGISVSKLWGVDTFNTLFFTNNMGISAGIGVDTVKEGDKLVASINKDNIYYADWYSFFDDTEKTVAPNEEFTLVLKGHYGMAYTPEDKAATALEGIKIGTWENGDFIEIEGAVTDEEGSVTLSFDKAGIYYVSASGTVSDSVQDWSAGGAFVEAECPIIAPGCVVTVEDTQAADAEAVSVVYNEFSGANTNKYNVSSKTPLVFPLEYNGTIYTNVISYLKAWTLNETGRELTVDFEYVNGAASYTDWTSGVKKTVTLNAFDENTEIISGYFKDNEPTAQRLSNVYFTIGSAKSERIASIYVKSTSLVRSENEIVEFIASNLPFARIRGKNTSANEIIQTVGETTATSVGTLPSSDSLYTKNTAEIEWSLENVSGKADALEIVSNKVSVTRPNVGEGNAVFKLIATIKSVNEPEAVKEVYYDLTVPEFDGVVIPVQVTEGATLTITDNYYKAPVGSQYIVKQEIAPAGYDLYYCMLHASATGSNQSFAYKVEKENHITQSGTINVGKNTPAEAYVFDLAVSSDDDTKLASLEITTPIKGEFNFDPDVTEYEVEVEGVTQVKFSGVVSVNGASAKITSYYSSLANANKGKLTTSGKALTTTCYIPDEAGNSVIKITVTAPAGSVQENQTREYVINVKKTAKSNPMTSLVLTAASSGNGIKNSVDIEGVAEEEILSPSFINGGKEEVYHYTVNYFRDKLEIKPTAKDSIITVNGKTVASGSTSEPFSLEVGDNTIIIAVTKDEVTTEYKLIIHRKAELRITDVTLEEGALAITPAQDGSGWTGSCNFAANAKTIHVTYHTNITENVTINVTYDGKTYTGIPGEPIALPVENSEVIMPKTHIIRKTENGTEGQSYVISFRRVSADAPSEVSSYLPAPGQFVNLESYQNPVKTLSGSGLITLGAFGGNIVYKYDEPIKNNPNNPYGIDFIVMGNCFSNSDGSTSKGAAEPASVMVSEDGETWYELAGSEYYDASTRHNLTVTYTNGNPEFSFAADTLWMDSNGESGILPKNEYHNQPYYPDPSYYNVYQGEIGKNSTFSAESVSFTGSMIETGFYPFGYADSHAELTGMVNKATNPYVEHHESVYNGDGFDIDWAVNENGDPVELDEISYIKIYNPVLSYSSAAGEKSPEIKTVMRAMPKESAVGLSEGLSTLVINGDNISLSEDVYTYSVDGKGASSLVISPKTVNEDANIYVSNQRVDSGESSSGITAVRKLRIIVQEGEKEPVIYILNLTNIETPESNADLSAVTLSPGDKKHSPDEDGNVSFDVANGVSAIRFTPDAANKRAEMVLSGGMLKETVSLKSGVLSESLKLNVGENIFTLTVKSVNNEITKVYKITVTRESGEGASGDVLPMDTIKVKFSLTGDTAHYDYDSGSYTGKHSNPTWIASKTVEIPESSTVKYLTEMMLNNAGINYTTDGIYISEIKGLSEFDNGPNSGWIYRQNGYIAEEGYASRTLEDGDVIKWFYSDDYTKEADYEGSWDSVNSGSGGSRTVKTEDEEEIPETAKAGVFNDVSGHWAFEAIDYVYSRAIMHGVADGIFAPDSDMTRAMLVTVLYRLENPETVTGKNKFTDVEEGTWYDSAVLWAAENGIVTGVGNNSFAPNENITREQMAVIIYRYAKMKGKNTLETAELSHFADSGEISDWALDAVKWANASGLVTGTSKASISPKSTATRAQVATILMRFCESIAK